MDPAGLQQDVPIWIGGRTARSLRRARELGDGWAPFGLTPAEIRALLDGSALPAPFDVVLQPPVPIDPSADLDRAAEVLAGLADAGATHAALRFVHHSADHYIEQLEAARGLGA